jgi:hypothetical protein
MPQSPDIAVYDRQGHRVLVAEVKAKPASSPEWAASMRRNLAAQGLLANAKYFLLAAPDTFYFWSQNARGIESRPPDLALDSTSVLEPYYRSGGSSGNLGESSLELIVASWLNELLAGYGEKRLPESAAVWLKREGLLDAIRGGRLEQH